MSVMSETPAFEKVTSGLQFPEGPIAMPDGSVVLTEIKRGALTRVHPDGSTEQVADTGGGPNGAAVGPDGAIYVTNNGGFFIWTEIGEWTIPGEVPEDWTGGCLQRSTRTPAPSRCSTPSARAGRSGAQRPRLRRRRRHLVHRSRGQGGAGPDPCRRALPRPRRHVTPVAFNTESTNGIGLSPAGDRLYVAETHSGRLWAWDLTGPGQVGRDPGSPAAHGGTLLFDAPEGHLFDSLAVDGEGWVCVGTLGMGTGGITAVAPDGSTSDHYAIPDEPLITNICFGGDDLRTAYLTSSGRASC